MTKPNTLKNTMYSTIATYVEYFLGLFISILVARQLGPDQFGIYSYLIWLSALSMVIVNWGVSLGSIKFIAEARAKDSSDIVHIFGHYQKIQVKRMFFYAIITCVAVYYFGEKFIDKINSEIIYVVIAASMIKTLHMFYVSVLKGFEDFRALAVVAIIVSPLNIALIVFCYFTKQPLETYLWVYLVVSASYLTCSYFFLSKRIPKQKTQTQSINLKLKTRMSQHIWVAGWVAIIGFIVLRQSELFFLNIYSTPDEMAYYNVAFAIAFAAMALVPGVYSTILLPLMARENKEEKDRAVDRLKMSIRYMFQLVVALIFPVCFFAEEVFSILYGEQYIGAVLPFQIVMVCVSFKTLLDCTNAYLWSIDKQSLLFKVFIISAILTLSLDFFLIKHFQLKGALIAYFVSTCFLVASYLFILAKKLIIKLEWKKYFLTVISGLIAILFISPIGYYLPNIYGIILGSLGYIFIYIIMLLATLSFSSGDIILFRKLNHRIFMFFDGLLNNIHNRTKAGA